MYYINIYKYINWYIKRKTISIGLKPVSVNRNNRLGVLEKSKI